MSDIASVFFYETARKVVFEYIAEKLEKTDDTDFKFQDVYVVWSCFILGGWKCLISTNLPDGIYYEVTFNNQKREIYLEAYKKFDNVCIPYVT